MITWHLSMYGEKLFSSKIGQTASGAVTITSFMMKITLDPFIYCMRLTIYRKAFKRRGYWKDSLWSYRHWDFQAGVYVIVRIMFTNIKFNSFNDTWKFEYDHHLGIHKRKKNLLKRKGRHISKHRKY